MDNKIYIFAAIILVICLTGLVIYTNFEIYPKQKTVYPTGEAESNIYLALERWLETTGHNVRIIFDSSLSSITEADEKVVIINSYWKYDLDETKKITEWIQRGNFLVVCDDFIKEESEIHEFFKEHGIITEEEMERIKLVYIQLGDGSITEVRKSYFMHNSQISSENNARLAWKLTGARTDESNMGILFIRKHDWNESKSILGAIMERGNFTPVIISALLLIFIGFWAVIPGFGLVINDKQRNSRPINERFTAEIRFLKKYRALDYYLNKMEKSEYSYNELIKQYRRKLNGNTEN